MHGRVLGKGAAAARLNLKAIEERVAPLGGRESSDDEFIVDLFLACGKPQGNVTRLRNGPLNIAADPATEVAQKNVVYFKEAADDPLAVLDELKTHLRWCGTAPASSSSPTPTSCLRSTPRPART